MPLTVRHYRPEDAVPLAALYRQSVAEIGSRDYTAAQVAAWLSVAPAAERIAALAGDGRLTLVAVDAGDGPQGFIDLEADGHIHFFYCAPAVIGTGVAPALYAALEQAARQRGLRRLHSEASEAARRFFLKQGFVVTARRDFAVSGVPIHNYAVEKPLP